MFLFHHLKKIMRAILIADCLKLCLGNNFIPKDCHVLFFKTNLFARNSRRFYLIKVKKASDYELM